uniref:Putative transposase n=1 Tax=Rhodococcus erythropolis TaxID=1833 RepID=Q6XMW1_RHOER|nr:putative transposase [Rhodococcus erythropolis]
MKSLPAASPDTRSNCDGFAVVRHAGDEPFRPRWPRSGARLAGQALDNGLMESTIGLYKTELIDRAASWSGRAEVERETAEWVRWFNADRLHSSIDYLSPIWYETRYREQRPPAASTPEVA